MNERIKELRKALDLSGDKFGQSIGLSRMAISNIENGRYGVTEQTIITICNIYNVNEDWLRTGEGSMFNKTKEGFLAELQKQYSLTDFQVSLVKNYLELSDKDKASIDKFIASCCEDSDNKEV
jgi:DNA-binding helix-turn-helix protein